MKRSRLSVLTRLLKERWRLTQYMTPMPLATKRPRRADNLSEDVLLIEPGASGSFSSDENEEKDHNPCQSLRWQANEELSSFLGKPLSPFEQKAVTKRYSRSKLDSLYTLTKENYLPSLVPGVKTVDKRMRFLQDRVSTTFGPVTM